MLLLLKRYTINTIKLFIRNIQDHHMSAYAAQASYYIMMSVLPFSILLLAIVRQSPVGYLAFREMIHKYAPEFINAVLANVLATAYDKNITMLASVTTLMVLWACGKGMLALRTGLNYTYGIRDTRNYFLIRILSTIYAMVVAISLTVMMFILITGRSLYRKYFLMVPILGKFFKLTTWIRYLTLFLFLTLLFFFIYEIFPNLHMKPHYVLPGALGCAGTWMVTTKLFSLYFITSGSLVDTYGSLAALMLLMLWLYVCMFEVLLFGQLNYLLHPDGQSIDHSVFLNESFRNSDL